MQTRSEEIIGVAGGIWGVVTIVIKMGKGFGLFGESKATKAEDAADACLRFHAHGAHGVALQNPLDL